MVQTIIDNKENIVNIITSLIALFAIIATMTPNESDNKVLAKIYKGINILGLNILKSENK